MKRTIATLCLGTASIAGAEPPASTYGLAWEETFAGPTIDETRWQYRTDVKAYSSQLPRNAVIENSQLSLLMKEESDRGKRFTGAGIITKQVFGYGYYEVITRTTSNAGWHNSFWMMRGDGTDTATAGKFLEIDSAEIDTESPSIIRYGIHMWDGTYGFSGTYGKRRCTNPSPAINTADAFHTFGVNWREGAVDFYVDGQLYCTKAYETDRFRQDPVNIWLTAIGYTSPVTVGGTPQLYDNVRFYKRDQYVYASYAGYTEAGTGWDASSVAGFGLMPQRYSCKAGASATFAPGFQQAGNYRVYIWKTVYDNSDTATAVTITTGGATTSATLDGTTGTSGWVDLGTFSFAAGMSGSVKTTRTNNCLRASAVKFVRS